METCKTCRYWKDRGDARQPAGECRRHAKVVISQNGTMDAGDDCWPWTERTDWCGDWEKVND